uniref:Uncharacterized protein n=1 Tax=Avena sativa TaxID=4498 RepID=A0ACD5UKB5_AVESA
MDKYTIRVVALALLFLHLVCSAAVGQSRIVSDDLDNEKINFPHGMCFYSKGCNDGVCFCCQVLSMCYATMKVCEKHCEESSASDTVATADPPLPVPA